MHDSKHSYFVSPFEDSTECLNRGKANAFLWAVVIFIIAVVIRWIPASYGLPHIHYWDEPSYLSMSLNILKTGDLDHRWYNIPPFFLYQHSVVQTVRFWAKAKDGKLKGVEELNVNILLNREIDDYSIVKWSRKYTALLGAGTCVLTFLLAIRCFDKRTALASGLALIFMPGHVEHSLFVTPDIPMAFFALLTVCCCAAHRSDNSPFVLFCLGMLAGLTAATKYNGGCVALAPLLLLIEKERFDLRFWFALVFGIVAGFTIGFPYWLIRLPQFINAVAFEFYHYNALYAADGISHKWGLEFIRYLANPGMGWILFILCAIGWGSVILRIRTQSVNWSVVAFPIAYSIFLLSQQTNIVRNVVPLMPWLAIGCGLGWIWIWDCLRVRFAEGWRRRCFLGFVVVFSIAAAAPAIDWSLTLKGMKETRLQAIDWLNCNASFHQTIGIPYDLRFSQASIQKLHRPVVILSQSDVHEQSRLGIDRMVCGSKPANMRWLSVLKNGGRLDPNMMEEKKKAELLGEFIHGFPPLYSISPEPVYPQRSTLSAFYEGYWLLDDAPVNPALVVFESSPNPSLVFRPLDRDALLVDAWDIEPPKWNASVKGTPLQINGVVYADGLGVYANTAVRLPVPEGAKRFIVDAGVSSDLYEKQLASIVVSLETGAQTSYHTPVLTKDSPAWRFDLPVDGCKEISLVVSDAGDGNEPDCAVLGYCGFLFERVESQTNPNRN